MKLSLVMDLAMPLSRTILHYLVSVTVACHYPDGMNSTDSFKIPSNQKKKKKIVFRILLASFHGYNCLLRSGPRLFLD